MPGRSRRRSRSPHHPRPNGMTPPRMRRARTRLTARADVSSRPAPGLRGRRSRLRGREGVAVGEGVRRLWLADFEFAWRRAFNHGDVVGFERVAGGVLEL